MSTIARSLAAARRTTCLVAAFAIVGFLGACSETPTSSSSDASGPIVAKKGKGGKPPQCDAFPALTITLRSAASDALQDDDEDGAVQSPYTEGEGNGSLGAHLSGNGNLMFWTSQYGTPDRSVLVTTTLIDASTFSVSTTDRIFTNSHMNPDGNDACGLAGMVDPTTAAMLATAVLEVELDGDGIVRYGKDCKGDPDENRVTTTRLGDTWTISGTEGVHCNSDPKKKGKRTLTVVGEAGAFSMTLAP